MASADTLCKKLLNVKNTVVESYNFYNDVDGVTHLRIKARPTAWHQDDCPFCGRRHLPRYDRPTKKNKIWRGLDFSGIIVEIEAATHRIICPEHGLEVDPAAFSLEAGCKNILAALRRKKNAD